jgi:hypothetical protein
MMGSPFPLSPRIQGGEGASPSTGSGRPLASSPWMGEDGRWGWHDGFTLPSIPSHRGRGGMRPL